VRLRLRRHRCRLLGLDSGDDNSHDLKPLL
jgi:hypothetical protein